jgi:hypothetical protein
MLRFQINNEDTGQSTPTRKKKRRSILKNSRHSKTPLYVEVDVGTAKWIRVSLDDIVTYRCIYEGSNSVLFQTTNKEGEDEVLVVRWSQSGSGSDDKDDLSISLVTDQSIVPAYKGKHRFMHQGVHVSVGVRRYIYGEPLSEVIKDASPELMSHYKIQIEAIVAQLSEVTSTHYGSILNGGLKATTVQGYISSGNLIGKLKNQKYVGYEVETKETSWNTKCKPRLCHGSLWPEHIIVNGTSIEGIVGWSNADFIPEAIDRYLYEMCVARSSINRNWSSFLSDIPCTDEAANDDTAKCAMIKYAQSTLASQVKGMNTTRVAQAAERTIRYHCGVRSARVSFAALNTREPAVYDPDDGRPSDQRSLSSLTDETLETWERSTATTGTTIKPWLSSSQDVLAPLHISTDQRSTM